MIKRRDKEIDDLYLRCGASALETLDLPSTADPPSDPTIGRLGKGSKEPPRGNLQYPSRRRAVKAPNTYSLIKAPGLSPSR